MARVPVYATVAGSNGQVLCISVDSTGALSYYDSYVPQNPIPVVADILGGSGRALLLVGDDTAGSLTAIPISYIPSAIEAVRVVAEDFQSLGIPQLVLTYNGSAFTAGLGARAITAPSFPGSLARRKRLPEVRVNSGLNINLFGGYGAAPATYDNEYRDITDADVAYLKARGVKVVRVPFRWEPLQPTLNGALEGGYLSSLQRTVNKLGTAGIQSMLDLHNMARRNFVASDINAAPQYYLGSAQLPVAALADVWAKLSAAFKSSSYVYGYDLMNEPETISDATWVTAAQGAITAIRANGDQTKIVVEGRSIGSNDFGTTNPTLHTLNDGASNLEFSHHTYPVGDGTASTFNGADAVGANVPASRLVDNITPFAAWLTTHSFKGNCGEYAVGMDNQLWMSMLDAFLTYCDTHNLPTFFWFFDQRGAGDPNNLWPIGGPQARQWPVIEKHNGVVDPAYAVSLTGPTASVYRSSPASIVLDLRGTVPANGAWTFSDGGKGGTFSPTSVSMTAGGFNFFPTVTYTTPTTDQSVTISATNNAGLTNPVPLALTVFGANPNTWSVPQLDSTMPTKAINFKNGISQYVGGTQDSDFLAATAALTKDTAGLVINQSITPSTALAALLPVHAAATIMVEVASFSSASGRVIGGLAALCNGVDSSTGQDRQIVAYLSSGAGTGVVNMTSGKPISQPQRVVLAWDGTSIRGVVGGGSVYETATTEGLSADHFGSDGGSPFFNHEIVSIAAWPFKGTSSGIQTLSGGTT